MTTLPMRRSGPWRCLLWKDFRQVSPTLIAVTLGGLAMQLLLVAAVIWGDENQELGSLAPVIACVAPVLFAIGACGMLVGHERQSGSWEWSSSLPVSWGYALSSKLLVSLSGAVFIAMLLAIVPVSLLLVGHLVIENTSLVMVYVSGMTLIALIEVVAYFFIATLLMRETLTALVIAGLGLCIGQVAIPALALAIASDRLVRWGLTPDFANMLISYSASFGILVVGMFAMLVAFRWRWTTGQRSAFLMRSTATAATAPSAAYVYSTPNSPGSWRVLLKLALNSSLWLRLSAVAVASLLMFGLEPITSSWGFGLALGSGLLGLSAFEGDQAQQRYRFLADRGLAPWKLVVSRLGIASAWMFGLWCGCLVLPITSPMALPITIAQAERMIMTIVLSSLGIFGQRIGRYLYSQARGSRHGHLCGFCRRTRELCLCDRICRRAFKAGWDMVGSGRAVRINAILVAYGHAGISGCHFSSCAAMDGLRRIAPAQIVFGSRITGLGTAHRWRVSDALRTGIKDGSRVVRIAQPRPTCRLGLGQRTGH
jgi:hypothetical protein